jgi:hypothetical protein
MKRLIILIFLIGAKCYAQTSITTDNILNVSANSNTSLSSANAENITVDKYTGKLIAGFSLANYKNKSTGLEHEISLHFLGGAGHKINDRAGFCGLNWAINLGGIITRQVVDIPDENANGFWSLPTSPNSFLQFDTLLLKEFATEAKDGQMDVYDYQVAGYSGKFIIGKNNEIITIPTQNIFIEMIPPPSTYTSSGNMDVCNSYTFKIKLPNGTTYYFNNFDCKHNRYERKKTN